MGEKKKNGLRGKVFVSALVVFSLMCSNVVAKAADGPVNQMFSENVAVVNADKTEVEIAPIDIQDKFLDFEFKTPEENFEVFIVDTSNDITYEIIYIDSEIKNIDAGVEPQHIHTIKDAVIKIHEKHSDGSCTTTYYEGRQCTGCGLTWRGDVIQVVTQPKCRH